MSASPPLVASAPEPVTQRRLNLIAVVLTLGAITTILDTTIVNIAIDHLHSTFGASVADTQWVATGYLLAFVAVIPVSGWAADRFGPKNVWATAIVLFALGSLACGLAWSLPSLIAFRLVQGLGGGMVLPLTITILTRAAGPDRIAKAMIAIALPGQLAPVLGPVIGGSIVESLDWRWLFFVNLPLCLIALAFGIGVLPDEPGQAGKRFDVLGFALLTPAVAALAYGISEGGTEGFAATVAWLPIALGVALLASFTGYALRTRNEPLIDVRVFTRRSFGLSSIITFVGGFSMYALMFLLPLFYQQVRGNSVLHTGLLLIPQGLGTMAFLVVFKKLSERVDGRYVVAGGVVLVMIGIVPFAFAGVTGGSALLLAAQFVQGIGLGAVSLPVMTLAFASLAPAEASRGSAAFSVVQRVGAPFGVAVIAAILNGYLAAGTDSGAPLAAFHHTFWWVFALSAIPFLLALAIPSATGEGDTAGPRAPVAVEG